jgi:hypothetical protein
VTPGQGGESRQGPTNAQTTGGKGGGPVKTPSSQGAGAQQPTFGGIGDFANLVGCGGGGASRAGAPSTDPNTSPRGGASADGSVTLTYVYLTT